MRDPLSRSFGGVQSSHDSWIQRVRDNFQQLLMPDRVFPSSANGAPIHLLRLEKSPRSRRAQTLSLLTHATIITALVFAAMHSPDKIHPPFPRDNKFPSSIPVPARLLQLLRGEHPSEGRGSGTGHDLLPPTAGNLPPLSSIQLLKPTLPQNQTHELPVPPTILDAAAPSVLTAVENIGLPWMPEQNNSSGRGKGNTIGDGPGDSIGSSPGELAGRGGTEGLYQPGWSQPRCAYCPDPQYTDEAREAKVQGTVTLQVLVSADGRALQIRVVRGIGMGLDERAAQAIRGWKFVPAHDGARHAVPAWVTVEAIYRLF